MYNETKQYNDDLKIENDNLNNVLIVYKEKIVTIIILELTS